MTFSLVDENDALRRDMDQHVVCLLAASLLVASHELGPFTIAWVWDVNCYHMPIL